MNALLIFMVLSIIVCVAAISFQQTSDRTIIAIIYAVAIVSHSVFCADFPGFLYFFSAGVFDLAVVGIVCSYKAVTRLTDDLINISILSIVLNAYGFVTWFNEQPIFSYQLTMVALYFIAILSLLRKDCADGRKLNRRHSCIRLFINKGLGLCQPAQKREVS